MQAKEIVDFKTQEFTEKMITFIFIIDTLKIPALKKIFEKEMLDLSSKQRCRTNSRFSLEKHQRREAHNVNKVHLQNGNFSNTPQPKLEWPGKLTLRKPFDIFKKLSKRYYHDIILDSNQQSFRKIINQSKQFRNMI